MAAMRQPDQPPPRHSVAHALGDMRLSAPSAARNAGPLVTALGPQLPARGEVLELASGTGEHVVAFARAFPGLSFQPSEIDEARLASIEAWRRWAGLENIRPALRLDAAAADAAGPRDAVITVNLMHLITRDEARRVIGAVARTLVPGGRWLLYGPFRTEGRFRSEGDARFHRALVAEDPAIGYKDAEWVSEEALAAGLTVLPPTEMPANNLLLAFGRDA